MRRRPACILLPAVALLAAAGCQPCPEKLVSLGQLVAEYNANAGAVPRLWARAKLSVTLADADGAFTFDKAPSGPYITATATDADGNTSVFSEPFSLPVE